MGPLIMKLLLILALFPLLVAGADQPNVLLIMADDFRDFGGAYTKELVKTPNMDRLRAHGTSFERAYVQYPVCNPSR
jgi:arylsulfatase A-like enzyme